MNCPSCSRPNGDGLEYCDYCGTPLATAAPVKRRTEAEGPLHAQPATAPKRVTEFEAPPAKAHVAGNDPFDPFQVPGKSPASGFAGGFRPASPSAQAQPAGRKRATEYDGGRKDAATPAGDSDGDVFAPGQKDAARYAGRRVVGWLVTFDGNADGSSFILREGRNLLGRDLDKSDVSVVGDDKVSGEHAFIIWRQGRARIADNNSQNGTFLNEEDVLGQVEVKDNDVVRVGRTRFIVRLLDPEKVATLWKPAAPSSG